MSKAKSTGTYQLCVRIERVQSYNIGTSGQLTESSVSSPLSPIQGVHHGNFKRRKRGI
jgi:hypothetical protein